MPHAIWKGHISFGLVNIPVVLHSAEKSFELHFKMLDKRNLSPIQYQRVNVENGKEVPWESIVKGYEIEPGKFVVLNDEDFAKVALENLKTIEIEDFVPAKEIDPIYFDKPYYLLPDKRGDKGYVLLREILRDTKKVGIARVMIRTRQYLAAIMPYDDAIIVSILRYPQELRKPSEFELPTKNIKEYKISKKEIEIAEQLIDTMTVAWKPSRYHDSYHDELLAWIQKKAKSGKKSVVIKSTKVLAAKNTNVVDFMELLKKSIKDKKRKPANPRTPKGPKSKNKGTTKKKPQRKKGS
jgi:DNA end-binding protein Ku